MSQLSAAHWRKFLLIALLLHFIFYVLIFLRVQTKDERKSPSHFVPAYLQTQTKSYSYNQPRINTRQQKTVSHRVKTQPTNSPSSTLGLEPPIKKDHDQIRKKSIIASSFEILQQDFMQKVVAHENQEPIYLIGDMDQPAEGIILILAKALSAKFSYPRLAGELGIKGRVIIAVTLHPDGRFSDIEILKSSDNADLDHAALRAVNQAPLADGADLFLKKPKRFVVGYIFR